MCINSFPKSGHMYCILVLFVYCVGPSELAGAIRVTQEQTASVQPIESNFSGTCVCTLHSSVVQVLCYALYSGVYSNLYFLTT